MSSETNTKKNQPLNIKIAVERPILKLGLPFLVGALNLFYFSLHPSFLEVFYDVTVETFQRFKEDLWQNDKKIGYNPLTTFFVVKFQILYFPPPLYCCSTPSWRGARTLQGSYPS